DGTAKAAGATTDPPGLTVALTYDGSSTPPTGAGDYAVVATIDDATYEGSASAVLAIAKAAQVIDFPFIADLLATATVNLSASGGGSDNPVTFAIDFGPAEIGPGNVLAFIGAGAVSITASQAGNDNYLPASPVTRSFNVSKATAAVALN